MNACAIPSPEFAFLTKILDCVSPFAPFLFPRQYKKLAMKLHPDRGGDPAKFQEIQAASEILLDPKKRAYYDKVWFVGTKMEAWPIPKGLAGWLV
jgi:hypothetical protein